MNPSGRRGQIGRPDAQPHSDGRSIRRTSLICIPILAGLVGFLLNETASYARNTLSNHPEWVSGKQLLSAPIMGVSEGLRSRNLLRQNRLNLEEWHGFNELIFRKAHPFGRLQAAFSLDQDAYLYVIFHRTAEMFRAVRLSRNQNLPSAVVTVKANGQFLEKQVLASVEIEPGWHHIDLEAGSEYVDVRLDGISLTRIEATPPSLQLIGFRAGRHRAVVDDVTVTNAAGQVVMDEDFRNDWHWWLQFATCFAGLLALIATILGIGRLTGVPAMKQLFRVVLASLLAAMLLTASLTFDYFYWSAQYPYPYVGHRQWQQSIMEVHWLEEVRRTLFDAFSMFDHHELGTDSSLESQQANNIREFLGRTSSMNSGSDIQIVRTHPEKSGVQEVFATVPDSASKFAEDIALHKAPSSYNLLWLGTSQTWGAGANLFYERMAIQVHLSLLQKTSGNIALGTYNASQRGSHPQTLSRRYDDYLHLLRPDVLIVNLSNSARKSEFAVYLRAIVKTAHSHNTNILFVLEPNSWEFLDDRLKAKHAVMRRIAKDADVPVLDMHKFFREKGLDDVGIISWDLVHLTSYGQQLAAEFLTTGIIEQIGLPEVR